MSASPRAQLTKTCPILASIRRSIVAVGAQDHDHRRVAVHLLSRLAANPAMGVYFPPRGSEVASSAKERRMGSKRADRREFLKGGAALAGGLTLGAVTPAIGQTSGEGGQTPAAGKFIKGNKEQIAYGERSRFVTSVRIPARRQAFARCLRARVSCGGAASGFGGGDHAILAPLRGDAPVAPSFRTSIPGSIVS